MKNNEIERVKKYFKVIEARNKRGDFSKINFVFQNRNTHQEYINYFYNFLIKTRNLLEKEFKDKKIRKRYKEILEKNGYVVKIFFTEKEPPNQRGIALITTNKETSEVFFGLYINRIKKDFVGLVYPFLHEITHLFIKNEKENIQYSENILLKISDILCQLKQTDYKNRTCLKCVLEYTPTANYQKYCPKCRIINRKEYYKKWVKEHSEKCKVYKKKWAEENPKKIREYNKKNYIKLREELFRVYGNNCVCCGEKIPLFLTLEHRNGGGKKDFKKYNSQGVYKNAIKEKDKIKYEILCWNCNQGKRLNNGICPHKQRKILNLTN